MNKPDTEFFKRSVGAIRTQIRKYLVELLQGTDFEHPFECSIPIGDWHAMGLSSLNMLHIDGMCIDEHNNVWLRWEGEDECSADFDDFPVDDLIEIIEGLE